MSAMVGASYITLAAPLSACRWTMLHCALSTMPACQLSRRLGRAFVFLYTVIGGLSMTTTDFGGKFGISFPRSKSINFSEFISPW